MSMTVFGRSLAVAAVAAVLVSAAPTLAPAAPVTGGPVDEASLPQVLGLIATRSPIPLNCEGGECSGYFSAFCMQEHRAKPAAGQNYEVAGYGAITLLLERQDGTSTEFATSGLLSFASQGEYTAVRVTMPEQRLASLGAKAVSVRVTKGVALVPVTAAAKPMADKDRAYAEGPRRLAAEGFFEGSSPRAETAVLMNRLINLLPAGDGVAEPMRDAIWNKATAPIGGVSLPAKQAARDAYDRCNYLKDQGVRMRVRGCMEKSHDDLLKSLNTDYWKSDSGM
jgi:hypothetical protein